MIKFDFEGLLEKWITYKLEWKLFETILSSLKKEILEKSSFHIIGDSITFLSGDLTEKINPKTKKMVITKIIIIFLSEILFIKLN